MEQKIIFVFGIKMVKMRRSEKLKVVVLILSEACKIVL